MTKPTKSKTPRTALANKAEDVALVCGKTEDGRGLHILRKRGAKLEAGVVQPLEEGKPIHGELVSLRQRGESPLCDVEVHYAPQRATGVNTGVNTAADSSANTGENTPDSAAQSETRGHPAQVASDSYRKNWDAIWKAGTARQPLLN